MARIRSIKPEFWTSEQVMECSPNARLLFIGMWNFADDLGRLPCSPKSIKAQIFPSDDFALDTIRGMVNDLAKNGLVVIYSVEDKDYLQITGWQHQRIDKPQPPKYPAPVSEGYPTIPRTLPPDRKGEDRKGTEENIRSPSAPKASEDFEALKKVYPRRKGNYGWKAAERKFNSLVKTGVDPKAIIAAARRLSETLSARVGTEYIPMPSSWLNSEDFLDLAVNSFEPADDGLIEVIRQDQLDAWDAYGQRVNGRTYPRNRAGGWRFPSKWPPDYEANILADVEKLMAGKAIQ